MNEDVLKPFPCKEIGCGMGFFTEDHLSVHFQAKHSKLNLEIPKGSNIQIFSDQTPTPTRLLNNCEELRVFDDLQNINPFEEGFRRAVEDNSNGLSCNSLTTPSNQDTLHTPQILPQFEPRLVKIETPVQDEPENLSLPTTPVEVISNIPKPSRDAKHIKDLKISPKVTTQPIPLLPKPSIIYATPLITSAPTIVNEDNKSNESVKDRLKNILLSNNATQIERKRIKTETVSTIFIGTMPLVTASPANLIMSNNSNRIRAASNDITQPENDDDVKTLNVTGSRKRTRGDRPEASNLKVERNRAAARRYRNKMKIQSQALQEKYEKSQREISNLKKELTDLKKELTQVKTLLLLHKDCPVSKAQMSSNPPAL